MEYYIGQIQSFAFAFPPKGWALCQGQILPLAQNQALYSLLGTTCGGDGQKTFGLPNLQGRAIVGTGQGSGLSNYTFGEQAGAETVTLLTANLPMHAHTLTPGSGIQVSNTGADLDVPTAGSALASGMDNGGNLISQYNSETPNIVLNTGGGSQTNPISLNGGSQPLPIRQPFAVINYSIALTGVYPSRG